jgi:hypothetical protein
MMFAFLNWYKSAQGIPNLIVKDHERTIESPMHRLINQSEFAT